MEKAAKQTLGVKTTRVHRPKAPQGNPGANREGMWMLVFFTPALGRTPVSSAFPNPSHPTLSKTPTAHLCHAGVNGMREPCISCEPPPKYSSTCSREVSLALLEAKPALPAKLLVTTVCERSREPERASDASMRPRLLRCSLLFSLAPGSLPSSFLP